MNKLKSLAGMSSDVSVASHQLHGIGLIRLIDPDSVNCQIKKVKFQETR